jgi:recombinational DNA repair protein RecR
VDGEWLEISDEALADLRQQFRQTPPPVAEMAVNLARAAADEAKAMFSGALAVPYESVASRMETCRACEHFIREQNRCALCGCFAELKVRMRSQHCPVGKW